MISVGRMCAIRTLFSCIVDNWFSTSIKKIQHYLFTTYFFIKLIITSPNPAATRCIHKMFTISENNFATLDTKCYQDVKFDLKMQEFSSHFVNQWNFTATGISPLAIAMCDQQWKCKGASKWWTKETLNDSYKITRIHVW